MAISRKWLFAGLIAASLAGCSGKSDDQMDLASSVPPPPPAPPDAPAEKKPEPPKYYYPLAEYRDPFVPLIGGQAYSGKGGAQLTAQSFANLELKGILRDRRGKIAVIASTDGESYVLKSGRIFDQRNHLILGVSGIIKENSVVLVAQNKVTKELTLKRTGTIK